MKSFTLCWNHWSALVALGGGGSGGWWWHQHQLTEAGHVREAATATANPATATNHPNHSPCYVTALHRLKRPDQHRGRGLAWLPFDDDYSTKLSKAHQVMNE